MPATRRYVRIQEPFVRIPLRNAAGQVELIDLWREDRLDPNPEDRAVYLVLDFAAEERARLDGDHYEYDMTGAITIDLQAIDRETGEGMALPHQRLVQPDLPTPPKGIESFRGVVVYEFSTRPLTGLIHLPVSPRRATDERSD